MWSIQLVLILFFISKGLYTAIIRHRPLHFSRQVGDLFHTSVVFFLYFNSSVTDDLNLSMIIKYLHMSIFVLYDHSASVFRNFFTRKFK